MKQPIMESYAQALALCLALLIVGAARAYSAERPENRRALVDRVTDWACYYGADRSILATPNVQMLVLDRDSLGRMDEGDKHHRLLIAYLSLGEINLNNPALAALTDRSMLVGPNPNWPDAVVVDVRSKSWRNFVLDHLATTAIADGYDGFMLDTLDSPLGLEEKDPKTYAHMGDALVGLIGDLRKAYPKAVIIGNGGLPVLPRTRTMLDGVLLEGIRSDYDFAAKTATRRAGDDLTTNLARLAGAKRSGLPVFVIDYLETDAAPTERALLADELRRDGCRPYLTTVDLGHLPMTEERPKR